MQPNRGPRASNEERQVLSRTACPARGAVDGVDDEIGPVVDARPVDRRMGGDDDRDVRPVEQVVEARSLAYDTGGIAKGPHVRIVVANVAAPGSETSQH